jgi:hypothetical protein
MKSQRVAVTALVISWGARARHPVGFKHGEVPV